MPGRSTLTATSRPSVVTAKCTWAIEAAATGTSSKLANNAVTGWPSSASMVRRASRPEKGGRWSCRRARSAATVSLSTSARVDSAWPSLMKDGPISCNAAVSRSPGRRASRRRANRRAQTISGGAMPIVSSGNSASCRARLSARRSRRHVLRSARSISGARTSRSAHHHDADLEVRAPKDASYPPTAVQRHDTQSHVAPSDVFEACPAQALGKLALGRETPDAFVKIAVGLGVAGDNATQQGQGAAGIGIVGAADRRRCHLAELQAIEAAAGLQHAMRLTQRLVDIGDVAQAEGDGVAIERTVGKRQVLGIARRPGEPFQQPAIGGTVAADRQHRGVDVADRYIGPIATPLHLAPQDAEGDVARAARHVEELFAGPRMQDINQSVL